MLPSSCTVHVGWFKFSPLFPFPRAYLLSQPFPPATSVPSPPPSRIPVVLPGSSSCGSSDNQRDEVVRNITSFTCLWGDCKDTRSGRAFNGSGSH